MGAREKRLVNVGAWDVDQFQRVANESLRCGIVYVHGIEANRRAFWEVVGHTIGRRWIGKLFRDLRGRKRFESAANVLKILGDFPRKMVGVWGRELAREAADSDNSILQQAGRKALENWEREVNGYRSRFRKRHSGKPAAARTPGLWAHSNGSGETLPY